MHMNIVLIFIININLIAINAKDLQNDVTTSPTPTSTLQRSISKDFTSESEYLTKRGIKETDLSSANTIAVAGKSYDPQPEFYRGPGSTGHYTSTQAPLYYNNNYKPYNSFKSSPVAFPDTYSTNNNNYNYNKYNGIVVGASGIVGGGTQDNSNSHLANSYNSWQHLKGKVGVLLNKKDTLQDRISVGHYGTAEHGSSTNGGYAYEGRPYGGQAQHAEYSHYGSNVAPSAHTSGYYGGSAAAEDIPFDVYGNKNHYSGSAANDYASYSLSDVHEPVAHKSHPDISHKALLAKSFLIPLASAAVLGLAAALVSNPLLLQLGTVSAGVAPGVAALGKRKRRDLTTSATPNNKSTNRLDLTAVGRNEKSSKLLPYRSHHPKQKKQHRRFVRT